ncbi:Na-K-Cl cotransporter [Balneolales bacterium ANBcel1]|nr:Na-K-Cl cotransporter [Balneolales bacterium ANBcel1]
MNLFSRKPHQSDHVVPPSEGGLGTFGGVFTPSILTILGVIMYLRFGWVVGNVGLTGTLIIVTLSTSITFLTAMSIAAIATDQRVRTGGAYYMISRSLGIESGGAIGIPLFLAQALSVALYTVGFAESVVGVFPELNFRMVGIITTAGVAGLALISARVAIRAQYFIMFGIALSLLSFILGGPVEPSAADTPAADGRHSEGFWTVFAVFFPAVTGIMAGVNMSGDLKDPARSIPRGTFAAIGTGYLIYMTLPILLVTRADALTLIEDPLIMRRMAWWGDAILIGVWGATLSSAVGSILGAPRVLQALARDGVLPRWMRWVGRGDGADDLPRIGTLVTMVVALVAVFLGNLNVIAPILTMFFLTTYGVLNLTAGIERLLDSPSFRPKFRVHWSLSLLGALGCVGVMFLINALATAIAMVFVFLIFSWLRSRELKTAWGDVRRGIWMALTRAGLMKMHADEDAKTWRPHPLVFSGVPTKRFHLVEFASSLTLNRGILTLSTILRNHEMTSDRRKGMERQIREFLSKKGIHCLVRVTSAPDPYEGMERMVESYGLGELVPNTIVMGDTENEEMIDHYSAIIASFHRLNRNVVIVHDNKERLFGDRRIIDVWWGGLQGNGGLLMVLAHLLISSQSWRHATVRIKMVVQDEQGARKAQKNLEDIIRNIRIVAEPMVLLANGRTFREIMPESSGDADLIFLGMAEPHDQFADYYYKMHKNLEGLPTTVLVLAAKDNTFGDILLKGDAEQ